MRKFLVFLVATTIMLGSFVVNAATLPSAKPAPPKASAIMIPLGSGQSISLQDLADMKASDYEKLSGKKLNLVDRLSFKIAQRKLRNSINADGTVNNKRLAKLFRRDGETGFHLGGFALGFLLGLIGVLIAYLINDEKKHNRVKWAWIGWGVWVVIFLIIVLH